jgi:tRNA (guanosine-2'-O-)-methyltransferase
MRRVRAIDGDLFRPRGQVRREIELAESDPLEVVEVLGGRLSEERRRRIDDVVAHRTRTIAAVVDGVHDPHNTAAVIRTADAYGIQDVHVVEGERKFLSSRKVTQGAHKWVDISVWSSAEPFFARMRQQGRQVLVAETEASDDVREIDVDRPTALVFGNEAEGISPLMRERADGAFRIPMHGFAESFNVSVAAAIALSILRDDGRGDLSPEEADVLRARFYLRAVRAGYDIVMLERGRRRGSGPGDQ